MNARKSSISALHFSPDGNQLLSGDANGMIFLWDVKTGKLTKYFKGIAKPINALSYNDAGNLLFIGYNDGEIKIWKRKI